ncbi:MAG: helicase-related protein, partial [Anaerolineae bacterium]
LVSSPAAAMATLQARSATAEAEDGADVDRIGERTVLDLDDADLEGLDAAPGADEGGQEQAPAGHAQRLRRMADEAEQLAGPEQDAKLRVGIRLVLTLLEQGHNPIVFCRFVPTAEYVAAHLREALGKRAEVAAVTGLLAPEEREERVHALGEHAHRVLVATDCLSEGINLQEWFDAVLHYDLSWNPTRHEQREGRVDRFGQQKEVVRAITLYGRDNLIDGLVLQVLLRKHRTIRTSLGISVPVPGNASEVIEALVQGLLLRDSRAAADQLALFDADAYAGALHRSWDAQVAREKRSRTLFAQRAIDPSEVAREWQAACQAVGAGVDAQRFVAEAVRAHGGSAIRQDGRLLVRLPEGERGLIEACGGCRDFVVAPSWPAPEGVLPLTRSHPLVEGLARYCMDSALDPLQQGVARRCGAVRTHAVSRRTTLLLLRLRYHLIVQKRDGERQLLAEESQLAAFAGAPDQAQWLADEEAQALLDARADANIEAPQITAFVAGVLQGIEHLQGPLQSLAERRARALLAAHERVRAAARIRGTRYDVRPHLPVDVLGVYVLLPA